MFRVDDFWKVGRMFTVVETQMIELQSTITCPECGYQHIETMPMDCGWLWKP